MPLDPLLRRARKPRGKFLITQRDRFEHALEEFSGTIDRFEADLQQARHKMEGRIRKIGAAIDKFDDAVERRRKAIEDRIAKIRRGAATRVEGEIDKRKEAIEARVAEFRGRIEKLDGEIVEKRKALEAKLKDETRFIRNWMDKPLVTGAVAPSSPALSRMMARYVDPAVGGPIIELGPGTGPVTEALIARGIPESRLVLVEYSADFAAMLRQRFPEATIVQGDAYAMAATLSGIVTVKAAATVSSLPLLNKPAKERSALIEQAFAMMHASSPFIQFTYGTASPVPYKKTAIEAEKSPRVWKNLPPAQVWIYRRPF